MPENSTNTIGYSALTPLNLLIDAGAIYKNYGVVGKEKLISATSGGNKFNVKIDFRDIKCDGVKGDAKGLKKIKKVEVSLDTNLLEVTTESLAMILLGEVDSATNVDYDIITGKTYIADTDYLENVAIVGTISGKGKPVIVIIKNALSTDGLKFEAKDDDDNVLPVKFTGHIDPNTPSALPYEIRYPKLLTGTPFNLLGTPVIDNAKIQLTFSDTVNASVFKDGFAATVNGVINVITACVRGTNQLNTVLLTLTTPPTAGQPVTIGYTLPLAGVRIKSATAVELQTFAPITVTNN
jgi:hypothetical protein